MPRRTKPCKVRSAGSMFTRTLAISVVCCGSGSSIRPITWDSRWLRVSCDGGFGRHHVLHEDHFFELAGTLTVEVEFIVTAEEANKLLDLVRTEKVRLFYALIPAQFGILNPDGADPPTEMQA